MTTLIFATGNAHKVEEVNSLLGGLITVKSLKDIGFLEELAETSDTLEGNAIQKAQTLYSALGVNCFAEDTGLEVGALNGEPGVRSARYAGEQRSDADNMALLLSNLQGKTNRRARFRTVIALILDGETYTFEGIAEGEIIEEPRGSGGFGYDPVFVPAGHRQTFAQMDAQAKNAISHRGKAVRQLISFLKNSFR